MIIVRSLFTWSTKYEHSYTPLKPLHIIIVKSLNKMFIIIICVFCIVHGAVVQHVIGMYIAGGVTYAHGTPCAWIGLVMSMKYSVYVKNCFVLAEGTHQVEQPFSTTVSITFLYVRYSAHKT